MFIKVLIPIITILFISNNSLFSQYKSNVTNQIDQNRIVPGQFIVKFKPTLGKTAGVNSAGLSNVIAKYNVNASKQLFSEAKDSDLKRSLNLNNIYVFETNKAADIQKIVDELNDEFNVEYAEPVYICETNSEPNDPRYSEQFHLRQVKAPEAWDVQTGDSSIVIGVADTGVDWDHEDLVDIIWSNSDEIPDNGIDDDANGYIDDIRGWDFVSGVSGSGDNDASPAEDGSTRDNNPMDFQGHGTHVAGIAAAHTNNNIGIASVASGVKVMPLRIGYRTNSGDGLGYTSWMAEAFIYAADNGAHVVNLSYGNSGQAIVDAAYYAFLKGVLIVEAAGNNNKISPSALGKQDWVISVASVTQNDKKTSYSTFGDDVEVSAPGGNSSKTILSTIVYPSSFYSNRKYTGFMGTSMAAPLVASVAALVKSHEPSLSSIDLFSRIVGTTDNIDDINPNHKKLLGSGRVNVYRALTENVNAVPKFKIISSTIDDAAGNGNGILDPGEKVKLKVKLKSVWQSASQVSIELKSDVNWPISIVNGTVNIGSIGGVLDKQHMDAEAEFIISAAGDAIPFPNIFDLVITADGMQQTIKLNVAVSPQVLFVADFSQSNNDVYDFSQIYFDAFAQSSIAFDYLHRLHLSVSEELLNKYKIVVWACEANNPSLNGIDKKALKAFLKNGGSLFISGQDIGWDLNANTSNADVPFFNDYLKSNFVKNDANKSGIFGVDLDPISDSLAFLFNQDYRISSKQSPDILEPGNGAVSIFNYSDGRCGAIRYSGDYNLVYFGFGGFESITDPTIRNKVMEKVMTWLIVGEYTLTKLKDTESSSEKYPVNFSVSNADLELNDVQLYWDTDGEQPFKTVAMTNLGNGNYFAEIPAQPQNTEVQYFVYAEVVNGGILRTESHSFFIGVDNTPPEIEVLESFQANSIRLFGLKPFGVNVKISDNVGIDSSTAKIYYAINDITPYQSQVVDAAENVENTFLGTFELNDPLEVGDKVSYYFSVEDISSSANKTASDTYEYFIDTLEIIDGFENGLNNWDLEGSWDLSTKQNSGIYALTESPDKYYEENLNISATYFFPYNLSLYKYAELNFHLKSLIKESDNDSLFVEVSNDGGITWNRELLCPFVVLRFSLQTVDLTNYTGNGMENIAFRFRFVSDSSGVFDGVWIDDVNIKVSFSSIVSVQKQQNSLPKEFSLSQNYPNPFNPSTIINYTLPKQSFVKFKIYDILGREVTTLVDRKQSAGEYKIEFDAAGLAGGIYIYQINAGDFTKSRKMILLK